tara:strand:+ start:779 stop:1732 length:954 start_codon:yes stop_codon:yes gene_type:complete
MRGLIGYTGFVGGNIRTQSEFDKFYNSKNIEEIRGNEFELLVCAGVSAIKWLANKEPQEDLDKINYLIDQLKTIKTKKIVLISTIDVYDTPINIDESITPNSEQQDAYGRNRYHLEKWVMEHFDDYLIVRLPALIGTGLKKNFIYDAMTLIPSMITPEKWASISSNLSEENQMLLKSVYNLDYNGNYSFDKDIGREKKESIKLLMKEIGFTSLVFTDADSEFPFYNLRNIWKDVSIAMSAKIRVLNLAVEPINCRDIANEVFGFEFANKTENRKPLYYDMKSIHFEKFGGSDGYLYDRKETIKQIRSFVAIEGVNII